ncbi:MAG: sodium/glutamate symporter [Sedimentibacter sp.]|uniref:sodium/glutamate symporter n=1 Tax=Sedimentibacter sp. TaxID=1960295 RepID=UPI00315980DC
MNIYDLFIDFAIASLLILIGQLFRAKFSFFQRFFIPSSMIAGFLGLLLGSQCLNILPFSEGIGSYAGVLIIIIFTVVGVNGFEFNKTNSKEEANRIIGFQLYRFVAFFMQFFIPIALTVTVIRSFYPDVNEGIGLLLAAGFSGGHGTAAAVGKTFAELGFAEATDLGMTFATVGILVGVFGGLIFIKWATKKGYTGYIKDFKYIGGDLKTGLISKENRQSLGDETISSVSLDTLCYHLSLILTVAGIGFYINKKVLAPYVLSGIPDFTVAYILALVLFLLLRKTQVYHYIDTRINTKIAGTCTDYLVFFGISAIKITVIIKYAIPLLILSLAGIVCTFLAVIPLGYRFIKDSWFEHSIFCYGYLTGVFAIGFVLLRIVDPDNKSKTIEDSAMTPLSGFLEIACWTSFPIMLVNGNGWTIVGLTLAGFIACIIIAVSGKMWHRDSLKDRQFIGISVSNKIKAS